MRTPADRAAQAHAAGVALSANGRPGAAARVLRAALRHLDAGAADPAANGPPTDTSARRATGRRAGDVAELRGRILVSLAWAEGERGRIALGLRLLDEAEPLIPQRRRGVLLGQRGLLLRRSGHDELALAEYDAAVGVLTEKTEPADLAKVLSNRALVHLAAARVGAARADLRRSSEIATRHGLHLSAAVARHNLGDLDLLAGDVPGALRTYAEVARDYEELAPGKLATLSLDRARALLAGGLFGEADRELGTAIDRSRRQRLSHIHAGAMLARAEAALIADRPAAARAHACRARALFLRWDNGRRAALASLVALRADHASRPRSAAAIATRARALADVLRQFGLPEDARVAGLLAVRALVGAGAPVEAERELGRCGRPGRTDRLDTRLLWRLARAEVAAGRTAAGRTAAGRELAAGLAELQRYRSQLGCLDLQTGAAVHGRDLARAGLAGALETGSAAEIYRWSERVRAQALLLPPVRPPDDPEAVAALEDLRRVRQALREAELSGRPAGALRARSDALQRRIRAHAWSAAGPGTAARPVRFGQVRSELAGGAMAIYLRDGPALRALVLTARSATTVELGRYAHAREALLRLRADLDAGAGRAMPRRLAEAVAEATRRDAAALAAAVLDPLLPLVGDRDLVVVPTGELVMVPWAVLPAIASRPVTVAPSASTWSAARARLRVLDLAGRVPTLLAAGPGNARGEEEVRAIARIRPHATVLIGASATPAATMRRLAGTALAHLAAHGRHEPDSALFCALELAGGEVMGYDLQRVGETPAVVVLSSCDLGLTEVRPGDETFGMVSALLSTGSAAVIASVSRIADETALGIMTSLHRGLGRGHPPAVALTAALADAGGPRSPAGFVCFGAG